MEKTTSPKEQIRYVKHRIPNTLVYEVMDGKPIYYRGYKNVINTEIDIEGIMGASVLQSVIVDLILQILYAKINKKKYKILASELGLHLNKKNNLAADIAIFDRKKLFLTKKIEAKYSEVVPEIIIEIDTKADLNNFDDVMDYYTQKTKKLFEFGVEKVVWVLTKNKKIIEAIPNANWLIKDWNKEIQLLENIEFSLDQLLKEDEIYDFVYTEDKEDKLT